MIFSPPEQTEDKTRDAAMSAFPSPPARSPGSRGEGMKVAIAYAAAALIWLGASEGLRRFLAPDLDVVERARWQACSGWLFIAGTGVLLLIVVRRHFRAGAGREREDEIRPKDRCLDANGQVSHDQDLRNDGTPRVTAETALRQRERELWQIIDLVPHFIFAKDEEGRFLLANEAVADAYGTGVKELIGKSDADFTRSEEELQHFRHDDLEVIRSGKAMSIPEETITDARGRTRILQTTKIPFIRAGSDIPAVLGVSTDITERKRAEEARKQSELLFRRIFESPVYGILIWDTDGTIFNANEAFLRMVGYSREELEKGLVNWAAMTPPEHKDVDRKAHQELHSVGFCTPFEKEYVRKDGSRLPVLLASSLIDRSDSRGISFVLDMTEQKRAEAALRASEERYRLAISAAGAVPYQRDYGADCYTFMGEGIESITGYSAAEMTPKKWNEIIRESIIRGEGAGLSGVDGHRRCLNGHLRLWQSDVRISTRSGEVRWVADTALQLQDEQGRVSGSLGILQDVTERVQTEVALRESENRFRTVVENIVDPLFVYDLEGRLADVNHQACATLGYTREELLRMDMSAIDGKTCPEELAALWKAAFSGGAVTVSRVYRRKDGNTFQVEARVGTLELQGRRFLLELARDLTERLEAERDRELFARLGFELAAADTLEKVAWTVQKTAVALWKLDAFFVSMRKSGLARYQMILKMDTVNGRLIERESLTYYQAGGLQEVEPLYRGEPILINRKSESDVPMGRFGSTDRPSASLMYAPMRTGRQIQGIVSVQSYTPGQFGQADLELLQRIADAAAPALERCRAKARASIFLKVGERLSEATTPEEAARIIVAVADEVVGWDACLLYLYSEKEDKAYPLIRTDIINGERRSVPAEFTEIEPRGYMRRTLSEEKPLLILRQESPAPEKYIPFGDEARPSASIIWVPIRTSSGTIGVLSVQTYTQNAYDDEDLNTLQALAAHCGGALERARAQKSLQEREERYRHAITEAGAVPYQLDYTSRTYVFVGEGIERITGYTSDEFNAELMRRMIVDVRMQGDTVGLSPGEASVQVRQARIKEWRADVCIRTRSGELRWLSDTSVQLLDEQGIPSGSLGILQDITERKRAEEALRQSEERYRRTITEAGAVPYQRDYGATDVFVFIGEGIERITGYTPGEMSLELWDEIVEEIIMLGEAAGVRKDEAVRRTRSGEIREWRCDIRIRTRTGEIRWLSDSSIQLLNESGQAIGSLGILVDITERKQAEQALRESEERYALAAQAANDGLWDWDLQSNSVYFGPRWKGMLGLAADEVGTSPDEWFHRVHPEDQQRVRAEIDAHVTGGAAPHFEVEYRMQHRDGSYRWMLCRGLAIRNEDGEAYRLAGSQTDVTERHMAEQQLLHDAFHDALTGLPNRALLMDRLEHVISRNRRRGDSVYAVIFVDLDRFKVINDSLGHLAGDLVLKTVARRLEQCVRPGDTVARFAGDEFTVLLEDLGDLADAESVANRIQREVSQPMKLDGHTVYTTVSMGIAPGSSEYQSPDELLRDADNALYRAKAAGKARHEIFDPSMHAKAVAVLELETELRRAIDQHELTLHYQPIVSLKTGRITGMEALLRWPHAQRGMIPPAAFVPMAEETGLIVPMGWWIIAEACSQLRKWQESRKFEQPLLMSINLSARQFMEPDLVERLKGIVRDAGVDPGGVAFEITESVLMENPEAVAPQLENLRAAGFHLHLDDFGTGYSSFSYLHRFPISTLKIDRSFVSRMGATGKEANITQSIIQLARNLGMGVTAEGVATAEQLDRLRKMDCECVQGYLIAKPAPASEVGALLEAGRTW